MSAGALSLATVSQTAGRFLYVSNYRKEVAILLSNIGDVTEVKWVRTRPITIHLNTDSEFGRKIIFTPKIEGFRILGSNPIVAELKELGRFNSNEQPESE